MRMLRVACLFAAFLAIAPSLPAQPNPLLAPKLSGNIFVQHFVVFGKGGDSDLHADIAWPKDATGPLPAIIHIHGGGWIGGTYHGGGIERLAQEGYFAATIEYRLDNVAKWPAQIQDCKCAVRWLRANAAKYNVDPNRIGVIGESAGGHLVACLGTMAGVKEDEGDGGWPGVSSAVQAVVDFYGPVDFMQKASFANYGPALFGTTYAANPDLWKSGCPLFSVAAGDPPMLLVHGDADPIVPIAQSRSFDAALTKAGVPHQLLVVKGAKHGFMPFLAKEPDSAKSIDQTVLDFFKQNLGPVTPPAPAK